MFKLKIYKTRDVKTPARGTSQSAGIDFFVPNDFGRLILKPQRDVNIPSGIKVKFPKGYALVAFNKSGVAVKRNLQIGACVVDSDYEGEIHLHVVNVGHKNQVIEGGEKLVQFIMLPIVLCDVKEEDSYKTENTERGDKGFGSTGIK